MIAADTFVTFARRNASTQGCPYLVIAETPNPIQDFAPEALRLRAERMMGTIVDGLTLPPDEIVRRIKDIAQQQIRPAGVVRSSVSI